MFTKLMQRKLELKRTQNQYFVQNRDLAQRYARLMRRCTILENRLSELMKENTQLQLEKSSEKAEYERDLENLEAFIDQRLKEIMELVKEMMERSELKRRQYPEPVKMDKLKNEGVIEEEQELNESVSSPVASSSGIIIKSPSQKRRRVSQTPIAETSQNNHFEIFEDSDDLIITDTRRDSFGNWLPMPLTDVTNSQNSSQRRNKRQKH